MDEDEIRIMLIELLDCENLNSWEYDFVNDLSVRESFWLTDAQEVTLTRIYNEKL